MKHYSKITWAVYIALALCLHIYTVYYVNLRYGANWALAVLFLPGLSQLVLCFVTVVVTDSFFNRYTNILYSSIVVFSVVRFVFEDLHTALLDKKYRSENKQEEDGRLSEAIECAEREDYRRACRIFLKIYKENALDTTACFGVGVCLVKLGKEQLGLDYIKKAAFQGNAEARKYLSEAGGSRPKEMLYAV